LVLCYKTTQNFCHQNLNLICCVLQGWNLGEPNGKRWLHLPKFNLCVRYWSGRTGYPMWDDNSCTRKYGFICQASLEWTRVTKKGQNGNKPRCKSCPIWGFYVYLSHQSKKNFLPLFLLKFLINWSGYLSEYLGEGQKIICMCPYVHVT